MIPFCSEGGGGVQEILILLVFKMAMLISIGGELGAAMNIQDVIQ